MSEIGNKTNTDKFFQSLTSDTSRLGALQKVLKPLQMMPVMSIVTAVMSKRQAPKEAVSMLLRSVDSAQLKEFQKHLTEEQYQLLVLAIRDQG